MSERSPIPITFERDGDAVHLTAIRPAGEGPFPGLILIPDVRGVSDHYLDVAARFAAEGFFTAVIDLYSREGAPTLADMPAVFAWIAALPDQRVLADLAGAADALAARREVRADAVGITGFCLGGQYALMAACRVPRLRACVSWYGMLRYAEHTERKPLSPLEMAPQLGCPYLGLFGAEDGLIPQADVEELRAILTRAGKLFDLRVYPGAGHAFFNDARPDAYRPEAAADAFPRAVRFLRAHLG
ncbi:dienelactone hydrolase family protein [bacterium]|nr:dienelactone hydrolase family protein [bacterium]